MKKIEELSTIADVSRSLIQKYIDKNGYTPTQFAKLVGVHPLQMLGFLRNERGLHVDTLVRIGEQVKSMKNGK